MKRVFLIILFVITLFTLVETAFAKVNGTESKEISSFEYLGNIAATFEQFPKFQWVMQVPDFNSVKWETGDYGDESAIGDINKENVNQSIFDAIKQFFSAVKGFFSSLWNCIVSITRNIGIIFTWIWNVISSVFDFLKNFVGWFLSLMRAFFPGLTDFLGGLQEKGASA